MRNQGATNITDGQLILGPLTIIGTGYTPTGEVVPMNPRFIFKDGPLMVIDQPIENIYNSVWNGNPDDKTPIQWHPYISPTASDAIDKSFTNGFTETVKEGMKNAARAAQAKGIQTRWWGIGQSWAWGTAYSLQKELGADWLHADNLDDAVAFEQDRLRSLSTECLPETGN